MVSFNITCKRAVAVCGWFAFMVTAPFATATELTAEQHAFVEKMVETHGFSATDVRQLLQDATVDQSILEAIQRPWEAKPWHQYYPIFLTEKRVDAGVRFWQQHQQALARAAETYGVPEQMIVAIIGVETFYGEYKGKYPVLDALVTLGFHYPPRQTFFRSELEQYLLLTREEQLPVRELAGSYAGAMGLGQFISSSYRHYAVDFDQDGVRDLLTNPVDAIGSVANYFHEHGWQPGAPVAVELERTDAHRDLVSEGMKPEQTVAQLINQGLQTATTLNVDDRAKVFAFEQPENQDYWLGLWNFYVITRYNHSHMYDMAVYQLSEQIQHAYQQTREP